MNTGRRYIKKKSSTSLKDGLISIWELDEVTGTTAFDSFGSNDLTNNGALIGQTSLFGTCYKTDGVSSYLENISIGNDINGLNNFSYSFWFKTTDDGVILGYNDENVRPSFYSSLTSTTRLYCYTFANAYLLPYYLNANDDNWHNVVCVIDNGVYMYVDGLLSQFVSGTISIFENDKLIVGTNYLYSRYIEMYIKQISFWSRTLTTGEITTLYNSGNGLAYTNW